MKKDKENVYFVWIKIQWINSKPHCYMVRYASIKRESTKWLLSIDDTYCLTSMAYLLSKSMDWFHQMIILQSLKMVAHQYYYSRTQKPQIQLKSIKTSLIFTRKSPNFLLSLLMNLRMLQIILEAYSFSNCLTNKSYEAIKWRQLTYLELVK